MSYSEQLCEQMSAFLDGELPEKEIELLLRRLEREPQLREKLARYAAIGETLRGEPAHASRGFSARVSQAIAQESRLSRLEPAATARPRQERAKPQWLRTAGGLVAGLSIAATVAGVAIVILQRQQNPAPGVQIAGTHTVDIGDTRGLGSPEAPSYTVPNPATTHPVVNVGTRLTDYVLAHSEYSSPLGRRNVLSGIIAEDPTLIDAAGGVAPPRAAAKPAETTEAPPPAPPQTQATEQPSGLVPVSSSPLEMPGSGQPPEFPERQP